MKVGERVSGKVLGVSFSGVILRVLSGYTEGISRVYRADLEWTRYIITLDAEAVVCGMMRTEIPFDPSDNDDRTFIRAVPELVGAK